MIENNIEYLSRVTKNAKFDTTPIVSEQKQNKVGKFNVAALLEQQPILNETTDLSDLRSVGSENKQLIAAIREVMREEIDRYFSDKMVLTESNNPQIIHFKIGNSLFKGTMEKIS